MNCDSVSVKTLDGTMTDGNMKDPYVKAVIYDVVQHLSTIKLSLSKSSESRLTITPRS